VAQVKISHNPLAFTAIVAGLCLLGQHFIGQKATWSAVQFLSLFGAEDQGNFIFYQHPNALLHQNLAWVGWISCFYLLIPLTLVTLTPGLSVRNLGLHFPPLKRLWPYLLFLGIMSPLIIWASNRPDFRATYPFYLPYGFTWSGKEGWEQLIVWELAYAFQFFCLEFFFRGFMVHTPSEKYRDSGVWLMLLPYVMIHYGKPVPEVFGALIAGVVLGWLSYRSRSIWGGFFLHVGVAWTMDLLSVIQR